MRRRRLLAGVGSGGLLASAGCLGLLDDEPQRYDSIFIENRDERTYPGILMVSDEEDERLIFGGEYEVPPETGLEIPEIGAEGNTYAIRALFVDQPKEFDWEVRSCPSNTDGGDMDFGVILEESSMRFVHNACDLALAGHNSEIEYVDHEEHMGSLILD